MTLPTWLYDDIDAELILLADIAYWDVDSGEEKIAHVASSTYHTEPGDTPASAEYTGVIQDDVYYERSMFAGDAIGGRSLPDRGALTVINTLDPDGDSLYDAWLDRSAIVFEGRSINLYLHDRRRPFSDRLQIIAGRTAATAFEENRITFQFRSEAYLLDRLLHQHHYAGTGGDEGAAEMKDKPKPYSFGRAFSVPLVTADAAALRGQVDPGPIEAIDAVRDRGIALTITTDYAEDLADGIVDLVAAPDGQVTADVRGSTLGGTYSATIGDILAYIAGELIGTVTVNTDAVDALNTAAPQAIGLHLPEEINALDALDMIAGGIGMPGAYHGFDRTGHFDCGLFQAPAEEADLSIDESEIEDGSLIVEPLGSVTHKVTLNALPNWQVQNPSELAGGVSLADRQLLSQTHRYTVTKTDGAVLTAYPNAAEMRVDTLMADPDEAEARCEALLAFWSAPRQRLTMNTNLKPLSVELNQTVRVTHPRFNLAAGKNARVVKFREYYLQRQVQLTLAG